MTKKILCLVTLLSCCTSLAIVPYYSIRSQSENAARELVGAGWNTQINLPDADDVYGNLSVTPEYTRSFRPRRICDCLFGCLANCCGSCCSCGTSCSTSCNPCCNPCGPCCDNDCCRIRISGSQVTNRGCCDWLADYFGLPTDYQSCVIFEPRIENFLVDFNLYFGMDKWCKGLYIRVHAPVVYTRWDLNMCECIENPGTNDHWFGYFNDGLMTRTIFTDPNKIGILRLGLVNSFTSFINCCDTIKSQPTRFSSLEQSDMTLFNFNHTSDDIVFHPLCHAKMDPCYRKKAGVADLQVAVGWNLWCDEDYHAGFNIRAAMPTGNRPQAEYLFEPIVGNGKHWELGVGFSSHGTFWRSEDEERCWSIFCDANVTHLFKTRQCRTFDLKCKPMSRYMLAAKYGTPVRDLTAGDTLASAQIPSKQFKGEYTPVANITTMVVDVSSSAQADVALMLQCMHNNWSFNLGYNLWARSCEKIEPLCTCCCPFEENTWGLKGDAFMYGYYEKVLTSQNLLIITPPLSATQSHATICGGTNNYPDGLDTIVWARNPGVDSRKLAWSSVNSVSLDIFTDVGVSTTFGQIYTSREPVLLSFCDIDFNGALTKGLTHKVFFHFDYTWKDRENWIPYVGFGGEVEFAHRPNCDDCCERGSNPCSQCYNSCGTSCNTLCNPCGWPYDVCCCTNACCCQYCAVSQWGIWVKGGVAFH